MRNIKREELLARWPNADRRLISGLIDAQDALYPKYGITTALRLAHFWAQVSHESGCGTEMSENLNYSAERMMQVWPNRFKALDIAKLYEHNPQKLANKVYGERKDLGNTQPGDGWKFRGRGLIQTTGREGYANLAKKTGLDLLNFPEMVNDPKTALLCALAEFSNYPGLLDACDRDDIRKVTKLINGGLTNLDDRIAELHAWKNLLGI